MEQIHTKTNGRVARALGFHVLAGISVYLLIIDLALAMPFWVSWATVALIVWHRANGGGRGWPWTLAWFLGWMAVFLVAIMIAIASTPEICTDCGAVF